MLIENLNNSDRLSQREKQKNLEDFRSTFELLIYAHKELRKALEGNSIDNQSQQLIEQRANKFKENCKEYNLTVREIEIVKLIAEGKSDKVIAGELFISHKTVHSHVTKILKKVSVNKRTALITRLGLDNY